MLVHPARLLDYGALIYYMYFVFLYTYFLFEYFINEWKTKLLTKFSKIGYRQFVLL
jgi:hypothetical protein